MDTAPNLTIYVNNLNNKISKQDIRLNLYLLFSAYGTVLDVVALKTSKMTGQAHVVFNNITSASLAIRDCNGMEFYGKPLKVCYAKGKSDVLSKLDGTYIPREKAPEANGVNHGTKRRREETEEEEEEDE